jgi:hypothetical protein
MRITDFRILFLGVRFGKGVLHELGGAASSEN